MQTELQAASESGVGLSALLAGRVIELGFSQRAVFGTCPVCNAGPGESCHADVGLQLGVPVSGGRMKDGDGAHLQRLQNAPKHVRVVSC